MARALIGLLLVVSLSFCFLEGCSNNAVKLDGVSVSNSKINRIVAAQERLLGSSYKEQAAAIRANVTQNLVDQELLFQEAKKEGVKVSNQALKEKIAELKRLWSSGTQSQMSLEAQGYTLGNMELVAMRELMIDGIMERQGKTKAEQLQQVQKLLAKLKRDGQSS